MTASMIALVIVPAFALLVIYGAARDVVSFTIPNWVSLALIALFVPAALAAGLGWAQAGLHLATGVVVLLVGMAAFAFGWLGGGDAKLLTAVALWMGWPDILPYLAVTAILGGVFTLVLVVARQRLLPVTQGFGWSVPLLERAKDIPYGVAIAGAALIYLPRTQIGAALLGAGA